MMQTPSQGRKKTEDRTGMVFDIQKFCTHDGPGIRTTVFLKGCLLRCPWCHNPEGWRAHRELFFTPRLCIDCRSCEDACPRRAARKTLRGSPRPETCNECLRCAEACPSGAIEVVGRRMSASEVLAEVEKDRTFYEESGGGVTLSGGEPMAQFAFTRALLQAARHADLHACMETCGSAPGKSYDRIVPLVNLFLWDLKDTHPERHHDNVGAALDQVVTNLLRVDAAGGATILRCVLIAGINLSAEHVDAIGQLYRRLRHCLGVSLLPYHPLGTSKRQRLGLPPEPSGVHGTPTEHQLTAVRRRLAELHVPCLEQ